MLKPMLAVTADLARVPFPCWSQEKHNGFRCIIDPEAGAVSREGRPISNPEARGLLSQAALWGLDGELTAPGGFEAAQAAFGGSEPLPAGWRYHVFDMVGASAFPERLATARRLVGSLGAQDVVTISEPLRHRDRASFEAAYEATIAGGGEGRVTRADGWGYREGKASATRCELVKHKPTDESEGVILGVRPRADDPDAVGAVTLLAGGREFSAPVALTRAQATRLMTQQANLPGRLGTYRHSGFTADGAPWCAAFIGVRRDLAA